MKAESLHFSHILIVSFKIRYVDAQKQNYTEEISHCLQIYGPNCIIHITKYKTFGSHQQVANLNI